MVEEAVGGAACEEGEGGEERDPVGDEIAEGLGEAGVEAGFDDRADEGDAEFGVVPPETAGGGGDGEAEGEGVGLTLGAGDGASDGSGVGLALGVGLGDAVGAGLGDAVGTDDGR